ncbi:MAG: hypothetical protein ABW133_10885, partial [Polyangiaceae bacterium]
GYRQLEFASGSSLYILARPAELESTDLHVMRYADPRPCVMQNIKAHSAGVGVFAAATTIAYTEEGTLPGTLRFADGDCHTYDFRLENSGLTWIESAEGFTVFQNTSRSNYADLMIVNPLTGSVRRIASEVQYFQQFSAFYIIGSQGKIRAFKPDWTPVADIGDEVKGGAAVGNSFFYEDRGGIHKVTATSYDSIDDKVIAANGCKIGFPRALGGSDGWTTYFAPCDAKKLVILNEATSHLSTLDIPDAEPGWLAFLPSQPNQSGDPATDPYYIFYLTEYSDKNQAGKLSVRLPDRRTVPLGTNAAFERLIALSSPEETHGFALVDVENDAGTFVRWEADGSTQVVAKGAVRGTSDLVTNYDGKTGQFGLLSDKSLNVVARQVPPYGFRMRDDKNRWTAIVDDFAESIGTLSITSSTLDFNDAARTPAPAPSLEIIARDVLWDSRASFVPAIPGIAYFINYDKKSDTGRLEYRNLELRFTATISDGVANYLRTAGGLIYSVPNGESAGSWVVRSR